ncbi:MAG: helix-turn-helix domain-containing protein [Pseudomonadota bacterium]
MSDVPASAAMAPATPTTAGGLLRQARQAQGLHIAALAAAIKVVPRKLELLESDQFDQLPDATFTRALAHTVCRTLKIDPAPILALLPPPKGHRLEQVAEGLNTPFLDRPGRLVPKDFANVSSPVLWIAGLIVVMTVAVYAVPAAWLDFSKAAVTRPRAADAVAPSVAQPLVAAPAPDAAASALPEPTAPAASEPVAVSAPDAVTADAASGVLQFRTTAQSWVEVIDARGQSLIARVLEPGENVGIDGVPPLKVRIGNVSGTQVTFKGQPVELAKSRDNLAKLELK